jgi:hypothetical protein
MIFVLPAYSPQLNPDEWVWKNVKHDRIGRAGVTNADDLKAKAVGRPKGRTPGLHAQCRQADNPAVQEAFSPRSLVIVHAGNRVDGPSAAAAAARFPESSVPLIARRVREILTELRPDVVVSAGAAGADLLVVAEALALSIPVCLVLPFDVGRFRAMSVSDRGQQWCRLFDEVLRDVTWRAGCALTELDEPETDDGLRAGNRVLIDRAQLLAGGGGIIALAVRSAPDLAAPPSMTDEFVALARRAGFAIIEIDPLTGGTKGEVAGRKGGGTA